MKETTRPLMTNLIFGESPRWHDNRLWFADWGTQEIIAAGIDGRSEVIVQLGLSSFQPISFDWLRDPPGAIWNDGSHIAYGLRDRLDAVDR